MPISRTRLLNCPSCGCEAEFSVVHNVNVEDQPDRRDAILDGTFQQQACVRCGTKFRMPPDFNYIDAARGQWIAALPPEKRPQARQCEEQVRGIFKKVHDAEAPENALAQSAGLTARITFGWAALKEKLLAAGAGLSDVVLELWKDTLLRGRPAPPEGAREFRLHEVTGDELVLAWIGDSEDVIETETHAASEFREFEQSAVNHQSLPEQFAGVLFVDRSRNEDNAA